MEISVFSVAGQKKEAINIADFIGAEEIQRRTLHEAIRVYQANRRQGTSATKTRGLVSGGGRKPWKQKGTGNARAGSNRSPLWRKGGTIFGPLPRSYRVDLPEEKRRAALRSALWLKAKSGSILALEQLDEKIQKSKNAHALLGKLKAEGRVLLSSDALSSQSRRAFANLPSVRLVDAGGLNALDVLDSKTIILTRAALNAIAKRLGGASHA